MKRDESVEIHIIISDYKNYQEHEEKVETIFEF